MCVQVGEVCTGVCTGKRLMKQWLHVYRCTGVCTGNVCVYRCTLQLCVSVCVCTGKRLMKQAVAVYVQVGGVSTGVQVCVQVYTTGVCVYR